MKYLWFALLVGGCAAGTSPTGEQLKRQITAITHQPRRSFERPGDFISIAPTPDSGSAITGDPYCDYSSCLPR